MSQSCPLCGKTKPEEALFCDDCAKKIQSEYEVDILKETETLNPSMVEPEDELPAVVNDLETENGAGSDLYSGLESEPEYKSGQDQEMEIEPKQQMILPKQRKRIGTSVLFGLAIVLLTGGFFIYNETIRKTNQDSRGWDVTVRANSVEGYLHYMEAYPNGAHFDEAQAGLHRLKSEEAAVWERMKVTANPAELRNFLHHHSENPYARLVRTRLDSLVWVRALQANTTAAYSDYIMQAENGSVAGDYIAEARKRYELLFAPPPDETLELDSLSETKP